MGTPLYFSLQVMREAGTLARLTEFLWPREHEEALEQEPSGVTVERVAIFFVLLTVGVSACSVVFVTEVSIRMLKCRYAIYCTSKH
jgi:hypothetical protein